MFCRVKRTASDERREIVLFSFVRRDVASWNQVVGPVDSSHGDIFFSGRFLASKKA